MQEDETLKEFLVGVILVGIFASIGGLITTFPAIGPQGNWAAVGIFLYLLDTMYSLFKYWTREK